MTKFKINKNKELPDEVINRHKDFGKLMNNHQAMMKYSKATKPLWKNPGLMSFIIVLSVVLLTFIISENEKIETDKKADSVAAVVPTLDSSTKSIAPQKATIGSSSSVINDGSLVDLVNNRYTKPEISYSTYKIDPKQGASIYHKSTRILIPASAFQDDGGNEITTEIEIRYREFRDPVDAYLVEIPMHYKEDGKAVQLESAGMFEIKGYTGKQAVYIKKPITVELASPEHGNSYNAYYLNEKTKVWENRGKETQFMRFMLQADEKEYPELKPFKNVIWELAVNDQQKDPSQFRTIFSKVWSSFAVSEAAVVNSNDVKIKQNSSESKFFAHPIALLNNEEANKRLMKAKFDEYYSLLKTKEKVERDLADAKRRQEEWLSSPQGKSYLEWAKSDNGQKQILSSRVVSVFAVNQFGIWNCDRPIDAPQGAKLTASFTDQFDKKLNLDEVYLVDYSVNSVFTFDKGQEISYNPKSKNILWTALPGGKIAIYAPEKFKGINKTKGDHNFKMEVIDFNGKDANEVKRILGMNEHITAKAEEKDENPVATYERVIQLKKPLRESDAFYKSETSEIDEGYRIDRADAEKDKAEAEAKLKAEQDRIKREAEYKARAEAEKAKQDAEKKVKYLLK